MMFRRISFPFILIILMISACAPAQKTYPTIVPSPTSTPMSIAESVVATPTETPYPTEAPKPLMIDVTKPLGTWVDSTFVPDQQVMSAYTPEQQSWIIQLITDPDHTPGNIKDWYDAAWGKGAANLTGDPSFAESIGYDISQALREINGINGAVPNPEAVKAVEEANARLAKYVEYLSAHGIRESAVPLSFALRQVNLGDPGNFPLKNNTSNPGYTVEGYDKPGYTFNLTLTGVGGNASGLTQQFLDNSLKYRITVGHNEERDTIFGEPFFITYPSALAITGDIVAFLPISGTPPDVAEEAAVRMWNAEGQIKYAIIRIQFQKETIQDGDKSCMIIPRSTSQLCTPGRVLPEAFISTWDDIRRENKIQATREKMIQLMNLADFIHPLRTSLQGDIHLIRFDSVFMDGALTIDDIKIPTVPPEFFQ